MNVLSWNVRGAGKINFVATLKSFITLYNPVIIAILEPRISGDRADVVSRKLGFDGICRADPMGFSGGGWVLWKGDVANVEILYASPYAIHALIRENGEPSWVLSFIYASKNEKIRDSFLECLNTFYKDTFFHRC